MTIARSLLGAITTHGTTLIEIAKARPWVVAGVTSAALGALFSVRRQRWLVEQQASLQDSMAGHPLLQGLMESGKPLSQRPIGLETVSESISPLDLKNLKEGPAWQSWLTCLEDRRTKLNCGLTLLSFAILDMVKAKDGFWSDLQRRVDELRAPGGNRSFDQQTETSGQIAQILKEIPDQLQDEHSKQQWTRSVAAFNFQDLFLASQSLATQTLVRNGEEALAVTKLVADAGKIHKQNMEARRLLQKFCGDDLSKSALFWYTVRPALLGLTLLGSGFLFTRYGSYLGERLKTLWPTIRM